MIAFKGFEKLEDAKKFKKENKKGMICGKESKTKSDRNHYSEIVLFGGLNEEKYPWCVKWNDV